MARRKKKKQKLILSQLSNILKHEKVDSFLVFLRTDPVVRNSFIVLVLFTIFTNLNLLKLGPLTVTEDRYITVMGTHTSVEKNKIATFITTIHNENPDKDTAINQVNLDTKSLTDIVINFGIDPVNIKTTSNTVYQVTDETASFSVRGVPPQEVWRATNSTEIILTDISKAVELTELLNSQKNVELYGPNYALEEDEIDEARLLANAIDNAEEKAKFIAKSKGKLLGRIINIEEVGSASIMPYGTVANYDLAVESSSFSPGSTKVTKSVVVKFELR